MSAYLGGFPWTGPTISGVSRCESGCFAQQRCSCGDTWPSCVPFQDVVNSRVVMPDAFLSGVGHLFKGRAVKGRWDPQVSSLHINYLELLASHLLPKNVLYFSKGIMYWYQHNHNDRKHKQVLKLFELGAVYWQAVL